MFAKLFLDTKSVFYDVTTFRYYLLVLTDPQNAERQVVGFFSKEKMSWDNNNVACILVFPPWQKRGLGQLLMGVSYELSRREGRLGGPEKRKDVFSNQVLRRHADRTISPIESWKKGISSILVSIDLSQHLVESFDSILDCGPDRSTNLDCTRGCGHGPERDGHDRAEQIARWISRVGQGQDRNLGPGTRDGGGHAGH